jgi:quinolinate synthase
MKNQTDTAHGSDVLRRIGEAKRALGKDLLLLAHFYQADDIVRFADFVGDSLQLAQQASQSRDARYIVFCSVSFMAETARMLCRPEQEVLHPEPRARCPLANMADITQVEAAWKQLTSLNRKIVPVVYVNSYADLKAFCARNGGMVCTSANVKKIFTHVLSQNASVFFFPDENMGRNISRDMGIREDEIFLWNSEKGTNLTGTDNPDKARVFLWEGFCIVHRVMGSRDIARLKNEHEGIRIIVHPECTPEVYALADLAGSTNFIKKTVDSSAPGSRWAVGTEANFVNRIKRTNPDKLVIPLREERCREMAKVTPDKLLTVLEGLLRGELVNRVTVDPDISRLAKVALSRMLEIG